MLIFSNGVVAPSHQRCSMLWPSKNAPILVYLIILSHGRSRLWRATSTLVIQGIMIRSWFCSRPRRRLSRTTRRTDYGHPPKFRGFSRLLIRQFHQSLFRYGIHTLAKWSLGRTEEVSYICFRTTFFQKIKNSANVDERRKCMCSFGLQARFLHTYKNITCVRDICIGPDSWFFA